MNMEMCIVKHSRKKCSGNLPEHQRAKARLEQIVHPLIKQEIQQTIEKIRTQGESDVILLDAAILLEAGWNQQCTQIVFIDTPYEQRLNRVQRSRSWSREDFDSRESSQWSLDQKTERLLQSLLIIQVLWRKPGKSC